MSHLEPPAEQSSDGISFVPTLKGQALPREFIFSYLPHSPRVPDWVPAAVSIHHGDWNPIRVFHGNHRVAFDGGSRRARPQPSSVEPVRDSKKAKPESK